MKKLVLASQKGGVGKTTLALHLAGQWAREGRRVTQANAQDDPARAEKLRQDLRERDHRDTTRTAAPLRPAPDAIHIDSSALDIDEVIARAEQIVAEKLKALGL